VVFEFCGAWRSKSQCWSRSHGMPLGMRVFVRFASGGWKQLAAEYCTIPKSRCHDQVHRLMSLSSPILRVATKFVGMFAEESCNGYADSERVRCGSMLARMILIALTLSKPWFHDDVVNHVQSMWLYPRTNRHLMPVKSSPRLDVTKMDPHHYLPRMEAESDNCHDINLRHY
jgi:hypothetical protein